MGETLQVGRVSNLMADARYRPEATLAPKYPIALATSEMALARTAIPVTAACIQTVLRRATTTHYALDLTRPSAPRCSVPTARPRQFAIRPPEPSTSGRP